MLLSRQLYLILGGLNSLCGVLCALYPTQPYSKTVFTSGHYESVTWIDNGKYPRIQDLGSLTIDLYRAHGGLIATLARYVQPHWYGIQVQIPGDLKNDGLYYLRFNGRGLGEGIYTAYFTIREDDGGHQIPSSQSKIASTSNSITISTSVAYPLKSLLNMQKSTSLSSVSGSTLSSSSSISTSCSTLTRTTTDFLSTSTVVASPLDRGTPGRISSNALTFSRTGRVERDRFKFVFIVWPALIGICMAF